MYNVLKIVLAHQTPLAEFITSKSLSSLDLADREAYINLSEPNALHDCSEHTLDRNYQKNQFKAKTASDLQAVALIMSFRVPAGCIILRRPLFSKSIQSLSPDWVTRRWKTR